MKPKHTNILLVEDDLALSRLLKKNLERADYSISCTSVPTLSSAIDHLQSNRVDNVLLDLSLPDSKGLKTFERIRQANSDISIVILTGNHDTETQLQALRYGADEYVIKSPEMFKSLVESIRRAIDNRKTFSLLKQAYEQFKEAFRETTTATVCINPHGRIIDFNEQARSLWEMKNNEILGKSFLQNCINRNERFNIYLNLRETLSGRDVKGPRSTVIRKDHSKHLLMWDFTSVKNSKGKITGIIAVAHDITKIESVPNALAMAKDIKLKPEMNKTIDLLIASLCAMLDNIEEHNPSKDDTKSLKDLACSSSNTDISKINPKNAASIERLILSLIEPQN
jgi:PAS domain S-box-containing protein